MDAYFDSRTFRALLFTVMVLLPIGLLLTWDAIGNYRSRPVDPEVERLVKALAGIWSNEVVGNERSPPFLIRLEILPSSEDLAGGRWVSFRHYWKPSDRERAAEFRLICSLDYHLKRTGSGITARGYETYGQETLRHRPLILAITEDGYEGSTRRATGDFLSCELSDLSLKGGRLTLKGGERYRIPYVFKRTAD